VAVVTNTDQAMGLQGTPRGASWLAFASTMLLISGGFKILDALWAFQNDDELSEGVQTVLFEDDLTAWAWVWLVAGIALIAAAIALVSGVQWARWVGIVTAGVSAISFLPWIYYQPLWTILSVVLAVLVIYALAMYGGFAQSGSHRGY
jgi:uncharacterized membrane protein